MSVLNYPDWLVLDIDPNEQGRGALHGFEQARQAALTIHQHLEKMSLYHVAKLSGKRGVHIYLPIKRLYKFDQVRKAAQRFSQQLAEKYGRFTTEWHVDQRQGRVFLDWQQNSRAKSQAAPYSTRATIPPQVSWPVSWEELATTTPEQHTLENVLHNTEPIADPWDDILKHAQELPEEWLR
jgi:bifunctional non-homologous end joining protein LigD